MTDNLTGGYEATRYLLGLGHARIGCITGRSTTSPSSQRTVGYRRALAEAGVAPDEKLIVRGDFRFEIRVLGRSTAAQPARSPDCDLRQQRSDGGRGDRRGGRVGPGGAR